jgi:Helix-turn-helix domain
VGSGNVFADLGLKDAEELLVKAGLVLEITKVIKRLGLKQVDAANLRLKGGKGIERQIVHGGLDQRASGASFCSEFDRRKAR